MQRSLFFASLLCLAVLPACWAAEHGKFKEVTDPAEAAKDPDFAFQGEYKGRGIVPGGDEKTVGAQVVARGNGNFVIYFLEDGLPGDGWTRDKGRIEATGKREGDHVTITAPKAEGVIRDGKLIVEHEDGRLVLERVERKSPTLGAKPPKGAIVLFDGSNTDHWDPGVLTEDGNLLSNALTKDKFNSYTLHLEFRLSWMPEATGQARSNSGVYLHDCYEVQVLDSFGLTGEDNECGGIYKVKKPDVNMCLPPMTWQTYDIEFTAPKYEDGKKTANARATIKHNGVVIHEDLELPGATPGRQSEGPGPRPLYLQGHGNHVFYRNIWVVPKD
ncbi:MAG: DUF1080 domain-containing protein [Planctomycetota bacterium]|nr:MAG: DUF1080 domain-containing protein [Planctomycetota bacterium]